MKLICTNQLSEKKEISMRIYYQIRNKTKKKCAHKKYYDYESLLTWFRITRKKIESPQNKI